MKKAIVFDVDGVVIDSTATKMSAFRDVLSRYIDEPEIMEAMIAKGLNRKFLAQKVSEKYSDVSAVNIIAEINHELAEFEVDSSYDSISDTIQYIEKFHPDFVFFTNTAMHKKSVVELFEKLGITQYFMELLSYDDGTKRENIEYIIQVYNLKPEDIVFIDDNIHNIESVTPTGVHTLLFQQD